MISTDFDARMTCTRRLNAATGSPLYGHPDRGRARGRDGRAPRGRLGLRQRRLGRGLGDGLGDCTRPRRAAAAD
jgi:hypothetical protein